MLSLFEICALDSALVLNPFCNGAIATPSWSVRKCQDLLRDLHSSQLYFPHWGNAHALSCRAYGIEPDPDALDNLVDQRRGKTHAKNEKRNGADRLMEDPLGVDV